MKLYFLRHGQADWPDWQGPDEDRPLTKKGKKQVKRVAKLFAGAGVQPSIVLTSPLLRSAKTAQIVGKELEVEVRDEPRLAPGLDIDILAALLREHEGEDVMLVGHEPSFSQLIETLTGGRVAMTKAGLARVDLDDSNEMRGTLMLLLSPKVSSG